MHPTSPTVPNNYDKTTNTVRSVHAQHKTIFNHDQKKYNIESFFSAPQSMPSEHVGECEYEEKEQQTVAREFREPAENKEDAAKKTTMAVFVPVASNRGTGAWNELFRQLKIYRSLNGHCKVPQHYIQSRLKLGKWVSNQRQQFIKRQRGEYTFLTEERIKALDDLDFRWHLDRSGCTWEEIVSHLAQFKHVHGHTNVPYHYDKTSTHKIKLGVWVRRQREEMSKLLRNKKSTLTQKRIDDLNALGFVWKLSKSPKSKNKEESSSEDSAKSVSINNQEEAGGLLLGHEEAAGDIARTNPDESIYRESCNFYPTRPTTLDCREYHSFMRTKYPATAHNQSLPQSSSRFFSSDQGRLHPDSSLPACGIRDNKFRHGESLEEENSRSLFSNLRYHPISYSAPDSLVDDNAFWSQGVPPPSNFLKLGSMERMTRSADLSDLLSQSRRRREQMEAALAVERGRLYLENASNRCLRGNLQSIVAQNRLQERHDALLLSSRLANSSNYMESLSFPLRSLCDAATLHRSSVGGPFSLRNAVFSNEESAAMRLPFIVDTAIPGTVSHLDAITYPSNSDYF